ncbi:MAG TPA: ThiF family adenylyltransferase, partial [Iamia sp.]|nr:ThiF family adenylyltransferase [Iamia sp.]
MRNRRSPSTSSISDQLVYEVPPCPTHADRDDTIEMVFSTDALADLLASVGALPPESGAKLFGPVEGLGVDVVEFDIRGSSRASGAVYAPDTEWGTGRLQHWIAQEGPAQRIWTGDAHSHPGLIGIPSPKVGPGLGDIGYVEAVFEQNEIQAEFLIPILTGAGGCGPIRIAPWLVRRAEPTRARWVPFRVVDHAAEFPRRALNPAFGRAEDGRARGFDADRLVRPDHDVVVRTDARGRTLVDVEVCGTRISLVVETTGDVVRAEVRDRSDEVRHIGLIGPGADPLEAARRLVAAGTLLGGIPASPTSRSVPPSSSDRRTRGLLSGAFRDRHVVIAGVSGGSHMVEKLARLGPRRITAIDLDVVETANLARTAFRVGQVGQRKVDAIVEIVSDANPAVDVVPVGCDLTTLGPTELRDLLADADLIVAGTDSFVAQATIN